MSEISTKTIIVYQFNKNSQHKEYIGPVTLSEKDGDLDILESQIQNADVWLVPGDCTLAQPGIDVENKKQIYLGNDQWSYIEDYVGINYWTTNGQKFTITELGQVIPPGVSLSEPPPSIETLKAKKSAELKVKVNNALVAGFKSNALGSIHNYGSDLTDQINMTGNVVRSQTVGLPNGWTTEQLCGDLDNNWAYRPHTKQQIQQVGEAFIVMKITLLVRHNEAQNLLASIQTDTAEKIAAIDFNTEVEGL